MHVIALLVTSHHSGLFGCFLLLVRKLLLQRLDLLLQRIHLVDQLTHLTVVHLLVLSLLNSLEDGHLTVSQLRCLLPACNASYGDA